MTLFWMNFRLSLKEKHLAICKKQYDGGQKVYLEYKTIIPAKIGKVECYI